MSCLYFIHYLLYNLAYSWDTLQSQGVMTREQGHRNQAARPPLASKRRPGPLTFALVIALLTL